MPDRLHDLTFYLMIPTIDTGIIPTQGVATMVTVPGHLDTQAVDAQLGHAPEYFGR